MEECLSRDYLYSNLRSAKKAYAFLGALKAVQEAEHRSRLGFATLESTSNSPAY